MTHTNKRLPAVGETIYPVFDRCSDWPCEVVSVLSHCETASIVAEATLPYLDQVFRVVVDHHEDFIQEPHPKDHVLWYRVTGTDERGDDVVEQYLCHEHAINRATSLDDPEVLTFHNENVVKTEDAVAINEAAVQLSEI